MRVLLLGSGGREHALAWRILKSPLLTELLCAPGNPGTAQLCTNLPLAIEDPAAVTALAKDRQVDLVVVGPEAPLVKGVADALARAGIAVFGPCAAAAAIEGSKAFAKEIMAAAKIPTARFRVFDHAGEAEAYARAEGRTVVKADGLAGGKGVVVAGTPEEAAEAVRSLSALGAAGQRLVVEERLEGEEVSVIALCDGERYVLLPPAQDHKRVGDGDTGPNTGGMGAYVPAPFLDEAGLARVGVEVIGPALAELRRRGAPFKGALYAGLMLTRDGLRVLEFNCRMGDPETQVLMMQLDEDVLPVLRACAHGELSQSELLSRSGATVGVVVAAEGYPHSPKTGQPISLRSGWGSDAELFHAGTRSDGSGRCFVAGGRVMTVVAHGADVAHAQARAYQAIEHVAFPGMHFRRDIASHALSPRK